MTVLEESKVNEAVENIWMTVLGLDAARGPKQADGRLRPSFVTGCIQVTGAWQGAVKLECSGSLARRIAAIMLSIDTRDVTGDEINDAVGELTNIIGGNVKALLPEPSELSMPAVTEGTDYLFSLPGSHPLAQMSFSCEGKPFEVTIFESRR
jgi:chemotaxis protein CheX